MNTTTNEFCIICGDDREFRHEVQPKDFDVRGQTLVLNLPVKVCQVCDTLEVEEGVDPAKMAFAQYREQKGMLTPKQIKQIRNRYDLSQRSLASLLGMSEATVNRYEGGGLQDMAHDVAIRSCEDPDVVRRLLKCNGDRLSKWQRKRVKEALKGETKKPQVTALTRILRRADQKLRMREQPSMNTGFRRLDREKYAAVVVWLCKHVPLVTATSINKLLFYADFLHFKSESVSLTGAAYCQMQHGPVPAAYLDLQSVMENDGIIEVREAQYANGYTGFEFSAGPRADEIDVTFTPRELKTLETVVQKLKGLTPSQLSKRSHQETAYRETPRGELIHYDKAADLSLPVPE